MTRVGCLSVVNKEGDDFGVQSVVWLWSFFVSPVKYASGATRCPTDLLGARDERIGIHETFPAGVLARGTGIDYAVSHMPHRLPSVFPHKGLLLFRAGPVAACVSSRLPLLSPGRLRGMGTQGLRRCGFCRAGPTLSIPFPTSSSRMLRCRRAQRRQGFLTLNLVRRLTPVSVGTVIWIAARHVKIPFICVRL